MCSEQATGEFDVAVVAPAAVHTTPGNYALQDSGLVDEAYLTGSLIVETTDLNTLGNGEGDALYFEVSELAAHPRDMSCDVRAMPDPPDEDFSQFFTGEGMEDWQTASLVIFRVMSTLNILTSSRTHPSGLTNPTRLGVMSFSTQILTLSIIPSRHRCKALLLAYKSILMPSLVYRPSKPVRSGLPRLRSRKITTKISSGSS
jgi:hypothetical protein